MVTVDIECGDIVNELEIGIKLNIIPVYCNTRYAYFAFQITYMGRILDGTNFVLDTYNDKIYCDPRVYNHLWDEFVLTDKIIYETNNKNIAMIDKNQCVNDIDTDILDMYPPTVSYVCKNIKKFCNCIKDVFVDNILLGGSL